MFYQASGLKLNSTKTEVLAVGQNEKFYTNNNPFRLKWVKERVYALGTWFYKDVSRIKEENKNEKLLQITQAIQHWSARKLTWFGKITVIKSVILSKLNYNISSIETSEALVTAVQKLINDFLWDNKPPRIKFKTAISKTQYGGLNLPHIESYVKSQKITWINRILKQQSHFVVHLLMHVLPNMNLCDFLSCNLHPDQLDERIPNFYRQILFSWFESRKSEKKENFCQEIIWFNQNIKVGGKSLWNEKWYGCGIKTISDLLNTSGNFLSYTEFKAKYKITCNFLEYAGMIKAIPKSWKSSIQKIDNKQKSSIQKIKIISSKTSYWQFVSNVEKTPTCIKAWSEQYGIIFNQDEWNSIFQLPWLITSNRKLVELQFKIIHKVYASDSHVNHFDKTIMADCTFCKVKNNTVHFFFYCVKAKQFWLDLNEWLKELYQERTINLNNVLFGVINNDDRTVRIYNYCILQAKWYFHKERKAMKNYEHYAITLQGFQKYLKQTLVIEKNFCENTERGNFFHLTYGDLLRAVS